MSAAAGWYPDPSDPSRHRLWDGREWTDRTKDPRDDAPAVSTLPPPARGDVPASRRGAAAHKRLPTWAIVVLAVVGLVLLIVLAPLVGVIALVVLITGIVALIRNTPTWLRFPSRRSAGVWRLVAAAVVFLSGTITQAMSPDAEAPAAAPEPSLVAEASAAPVDDGEPFEDDAIDATPFDGEAATAADASVTTDRTALAVLETLEVKGRAPQTGYDRDEFGQRWLDVDLNGCDTRNDVLARDLDDVERSGPCRVTSGALDDPFTGDEIAFVRGEGTSELVQIDHVVALSDAWQKGAQQLTADQRATFANDPLNLLAVSGAANAQKGDGDAATWLPANKPFRCEYVARQVAVKATYGLWVTEAERDAIARVLDACPDEPAPTSELAPVPAPPTPASEPAPAPAEPAEPAPAPAEPVAPAPAPAPAAPAPAPPADVFYQNCDAVRAAGAAPLYVDQPGYARKLDRDGDGIACE